MDVDIEEPDWKILAGMGSGAEKGLQAAGIDDFDGAVKACAALQSLDAASSAEYKLDDLICFLCLSQHREAISNPGMPAPACSVSIEEDLGLDPPPPAPIMLKRTLLDEAKAKADAADAAWKKAR